MSLEDGYYLPAGTLVSEPNDLPGFHVVMPGPGSCHDENYLVLTIDYTQAALTAMILGP